MGKGNKIGALWLREQRGGGGYMTGTIEINGRPQRVVVFPNRYRTEANRQPHHIIYEDTQVSSTERPERPVEDAVEPSAGPDNWR